MTLLDKIENILDLLEFAHDELKSFVQIIEEEGYDIDVDETKDLIADIRDALHDA